MRPATTAATARAFVVLGDGECTEGSVWESALWAAHQKLENLVAIVDPDALRDRRDRDALRARRPRSQVATRWEAVTVDGHDVRSLLDDGFARIGRTEEAAAQIVADGTGEGEGHLVHGGPPPMWRDRMPSEAEVATAPARAGAPSVRETSMAKNHSMRDVVVDAVYEAARRDVFFLAADLGAAALDRFRARAVPPPESPSST